MNEILELGKKTYDAFISDELLSKSDFLTDEIIEQIIDIFETSLEKTDISLEKDSIEDLTNYVLKYNTNRWQTGYVEPKIFAIALTLYALLQETIKQDSDNIWTPLVIYTLAEEPITQKNIDVEDVGSFFLCVLLVKFTRDVAIKGL